MTSKLRMFLGCVRLGFWESSRQRLFASLALFLILAVLVAVLGKDLSVRQEEKILKDIGLATMELIAVFFGLVGGSSVIAGEVEQHSFYFVLSRPVSRPSFVVGKFAGMAVAHLMNLAGMFLILCVVFAGVGVRVEVRLLVAVLGIAFQALLAAAVALAFSAFTSPTIAMVSSLACYIAGRWSEIIRSARDISPESPQLLWDAIYLALPNYRYMDFKALVVYGDMVPVGQLLGVTAYVTCYIGIALSIAILRFERKDLR